VMTPCGSHQVVLVGPLSFARPLLAALVPNGLVGRPTRNSPGSRLVID
jgi:hypothetical protein